MILCVTPNPVLEHTVVVRSVRLATVCRAQSSLFMASGKGLNTARAIQTLGGQTLSIGFIGGQNGSILNGLTMQDGLRTKWTQITNETRTSIIIADTDTGGTTCINEVGPTINHKQWRHFRELVLQEATTATDICFSGSLPPGLAPKDYIELIASLRSSTRRIWVDTSGLALRMALEVPRIMIKVNGDEMGEALGKPVNNVEQAIIAASEVQRRGVALVAITLGNDGAIMVCPDGRWWSKSPPIAVMDTAGSGDAFLAGMVHAMTSGETSITALQWAVACGSANATTIGSGSFPIETFRHILDKTMLQPV